ncbi:MAG: hypothetical protein RL585_1479, partial [Pseudomonadota bacterium]
GFGEDVIQSIYSFLDLAVYVISMTFATEGFAKRLHVAQALGSNPLPNK